VQRSPCPFLRLFLAKNLPFFPLHGSIGSAPPTPCPVPQASGFFLSKILGSLESAFLFDSVLTLPTKTGQLFSTQPSACFFSSTIAADPKFLFEIPLSRISWVLRLSSPLSCKVSTKCFSPSSLLLNSPPRFYVIYLPALENSWPMTLCVF